MIPVNMEPRIEQLAPKKLIGKRMKMSLSENKTGELWKSFMKDRNQIGNSIGSYLYSLQVYDPLYFNPFNPDKEFEKWAVAEVTDFNHVPDGMETILLNGGLYAVFIHQGAAKTGSKTFSYIFGTWLPNSEYTLDYRPHFEILGEKYKNDDPDSEEEIWIPIKKKDAISEYISSFPLEIKILLEQVRTAIKEAAPAASEVISYQMPAFKLNGMLVWYAAYARHIGFYPGASGIAAFRNELSVYKGAKGSVQFPHDKPLPLDLITRIVKYRVDENMLKAQTKKK